MSYEGWNWGNELDEWEDAPYAPYYPEYRKCNCGGKGTGRHTELCAYVRSTIARDGHLPPHITVVKQTPKQKALKKLNQIRYEITGEKTMSTLKFSTINDDNRVRTLKVREVCKVSTAIRVVGLQYTRSLRDVANLKIGTELGLRREPTNVHDSNAVEVFLGNKKIGYIERAEARQVCDVMLSLGDEAVKAVVSRIDTSQDIYNMLWVVLETTFYIKA